MMQYHVEFKTVPSQTTGVIRSKVRQDELTQVVPAACGEVWAFFRSTNLPRPGRHLALYLDCEINLEVGVETTEPFVGNERVVCSATPAGLVATVAHRGPYHLLGEAHRAIVKYCADHGHSLAGPNWEVYGHWTDDPAQLRTDVFYLLQAAAQSAD